jgi:cyclopropane fatty-acyl-phospholipid synthase-like methyltransferase
MADRVASHYSENLDLAGVIAKHLRSAGKDFQTATTTDLATVDEFHIRGRKATLELAEKMNLNADSNVLDIGSGLGGPARTLAETYGCRVTGIDLTQAFCDAAAAMSDWVGLGKRVSFQQGDATNLPLANNEFDAVMTIHVAMNIGAKDKTIWKLTGSSNQMEFLPFMTCCKVRVAKSCTPCRGHANHRSAIW